MQLRAKNARLSKWHVRIGLVFIQIDACWLLIGLMWGLCAWQVEGLDNRQYQSRHHGIWRLSVPPLLGCICCCG